MNKAGQKMAFVAKQLGFDPSYALPTTRAIYSEQQGTGATNENFSFFDGTNEAFPLTNITNGQFETNEALAIEKVGFYVRLQNGNMDASTTVGGTFNLIIGSQVVLKDVPVDSATNAGTSFSFVIGQNSDYRYITLAVPIVIPPLVSFRVELTNSNVIPIVDTVGVILYGMGILINFKTSL